MDENFQPENNVGGGVVCPLCAHKCRLTPGNYGICGVRKNQSGVIISVTNGHLVASNADPIEKKPLYHFLPGTSTYSIAAPGCNFRCSFCQNWEISQFRGSAAEQFVEKSRASTSAEIVATALREGCKSIAFTYTEPTVFFELMKEVSSIAQDAGLKTVMVTNGYMSHATVEECCTFIDAFNLDLKSFSEKFYRKYCGGSLGPVLENIHRIVNNGNWLELTTLLIPGENDSFNELTLAADFIAGISDEIPWHLSRFFPRFKFKDRNSTPETSLEIGYNIAKNSGLKFVYLGNSAGCANTFCSKCNAELITRSGYSITTPRLNGNHCASCGGEVNGVWY